MSPLLQAAGLPNRVRVIFVLAMSACLVSATHAMPAQAALDLPTLLVQACGELALGALLSFGLYSAFAVFSLAGNLLDLQIGFNIANIYDPITRSQSPLLASFLGLIAVVMFYISDAYQLLIRGLAYSLERIPLGTVDLPLNAGLVAAQFGKIYSLGLMLAAPVLFCLLLVEVGIAVLSRNLPQMNIFTLSPPVKIAVGLAVFAVTLGHLGTEFKRVFDNLFSFWEALL
jgi:flagellar biosynthetic protein FliR